VRRLAVALRQEAAAFSLRGPRALLALRPVLSVGLAVASSHAIGLQDSWWAAITAFVVMQEDFGASMERGILRIIGTLVGAALALALGPRVAGQAALFVLLMGIGAWVGLFGALVRRYSYAWVLGLVTFVMVSCEAVATAAAPDAHGDLFEFAAMRVANIVLGAVACVLVSGLSDPRLFARLRGRAPAVQAPVAATALAAAPDRSAAALHSLHGALAVALLSIAVSLHELKAFPQAMVTTIAVLIVPLGGSEIERRESVLQRMVQRFAGCLLAGACALLLLPLVEHRTWPCQMLLALGVWLGAYLQKGLPDVRYMGVQFSVAFMMVFVQDRGWTVAQGPALQRLGGVFAGIAGLCLVFGLSMLLRAAFGRRRSAP